MLKLREITKAYYVGDTPVPALRGVSLDFRESEFVSILGPSGCGKTTLLNIIGGLDHYSSGDLVIRGRSTREYRDGDWDTYRNHSIGFVFQSYHLIPHQTVLANVELALTLSGVPKGERRRRAEEALVRVGLGEHLRKRPNQLSGGQMQRVAIARALVNNPDILLADEPTGALDTETSVAVMDILREVAKEKLVIMVTHNPELAEQYSSRIIRLLDGAVVGDSNPYESESCAAEEGAREDEAPDAKKTERGERKEGKARRAREKRRSMSFLTALSLSLNNLLTKKGRTFITSFAGSIGIIGIALILSLSNGINAYITKIQEDTLTSYPIAIYEEEPDINAMISSLMGAGQSSQNRPEGGEDKVYSSAVFYALLNSMLSPEVNRNNLTNFKQYIENGGFDGIDHTLQYGYNTPLSVFTKDENAVYHRADIMALMAKLSGEMSGGVASDGENETVQTGFSGMSVWGEILPGRDGAYVSDVVKEQYDLIAGKWPTDKSHILLVVDDRNEVNDMTLYALGLKSEAEMMDLLMAALGGTDVNVEEEVESWDYEEILALRFKLLPEAFQYVDTDGDGVWENISGTASILKPILERVGGDALDLTITGIIRPNPDAVSASANGTLLYTSALTEHMILQTANSPVVKAQMASPEVDILTGLPFERDASTLPATDAERAAAFLAYATDSSLTPAARAQLLHDLIVTPSDKYVKEQVDAQMAGMPEREDIEGWVIAMYGAMYGNSEAIAAVIRDYLADLSDEELRGMLREALESAVRTQYANVMEREYARIRETPSERELSELTAPMLAALTTEEAKLAFVRGAHPWVGELSGEALDAAVSEVARARATESYAAMVAAGAVASSVLDLKCAGYLSDVYLPALDEAALAEAYILHVPDGSSPATYEENLSVFGYSDFDSPSSIAIYVSTFEDKDRIAAAISEYNRGVGEEDEITYTDYVAMIMSTVTYILDAITYVLVAFVSVSLVVSSIMIGIITYISVLERTKEIGILRAVGASKRDVSRVFNAETLIVGFAAGMIGIIVTLLLCIPINLILRALTGIASIGASLPLAAAGILVAISMLLTLIAGLFPSGVAAKRDPVVALRTE